MRHEKFFPLIGDDDEALAACPSHSALSVKASASQIVPIGSFTPWPTAGASAATQWQPAQPSDSDISGSLESMLNAVLSLLVRRLLAEQIAVPSTKEDR